MAGSPSDFMEVKHVMMRGTNREIGGRLAEIARNNFNVQLHTQPDPLVRKAISDYLQEHYPIHHQRMLGVADAYGISNDDEQFDLSTLPYLLDFSPGCSVAYIPPDKTQGGHSLLSRNYDFSLGTASQIAGLPPKPGELPVNARPYVFETYPDEGYASIYLCVYELLGGCIDGINSEGLTVVLLSDDESSAIYPIPPEFRPGVGLHEPQMLRFLLDTCANVQEAKTALLHTKQYHPFVPAHFIIADRYGNSFVWETSPPDHREHIVDGNGAIQVITNHLLYPGSRPVPDPSSDPGWTFNRHKMLSEAIARENGGITAESLKGAHTCVNFSPALAREIKGAERSPGSRDLGRTLWHSIYYIDERRVEVKFYLGESDDGQNRYSAYQSFQLQT